MTSGFLDIELTDPTVINKILSYLDKQSVSIARKEPHTPPLPAPPRIEVLSDYTIQRDFGFAEAVTDALSTKIYHHLNMQNVEVRAFTYLSGDFSTKD